MKISPDFRYRSQPLSEPRRELNGSNKFAKSRSILISLHKRVCHSFLTRLALGFWRERSNDIRKSGVISQRIPFRVQAKATITQGGGNAGEQRELFQGKIRFAGPGIDDCQILHQRSAINSIFADGKKLDRATPFPDRVSFATQSRIN